MQFFPCRNKRVFDHPLIVGLDNEGEVLEWRQYRPRPDFALKKKGLPCFLVEFDSSEEDADEFRLKAQMACALQIQLALDLGWNALIMGAYFKKDGQIHRYLCYKEKEKEKEKVRKRSYIWIG